MFHIYQEIPRVANWCKISSIRTMVFRPAAGFHMEPRLAPDEERLHEGCDMETQSVKKKSETSNNPSKSQPKSINNRQIPSENSQERSKCWKKTPNFHDIIGIMGYWVTKLGTKKFWRWPTSIQRPLNRNHPHRNGKPWDPKINRGQMWDFQAMLLYRCSKNRMLFDYGSISVFHPKLDQSLSKFLATWNIPGPWFHLHQLTCS